MKSLLLSSMIAAQLLFLGLVFTSTGGDAFHPAPNFVLDLGKPREKRWSGALSAILSDIPWELSFKDMFELQNRTVFNTMTPVQKAAVIQHTKDTFPDNVAEMQGIVADFASWGHPEVDLDYLCLWFWWHELAHATPANTTVGFSSLSATSVVHAAAAEGLKENERSGAPSFHYSSHPDCTGVLVLPEDKSLPIYHGRNLDQSTHTGRNMTMQVTAINSSNTADPTGTIYQVIDIYWFTTGFVTANSVGKLTLEENWRSADYHSAHTMEEIVNRITNKSANTMAQVHMYRHLLENVVGSIPAGSPAVFTTAVMWLNTTTFAAPFYGIVSGAGRQGAVLSVSWDNKYNRISYLNDDLSEKSGGNLWYLVQTNYDTFNPIQQENDIRRWTAMHALDMLGRKEGASRLGAWMTISSYPVHNRHTMYSVIMDVSEWHIGYKRQAMEPSPFYGRHHKYSGDN